MPIATHFLIYPILFHLICADLWNWTKLIAEIANKLIEGLDPIMIDASWMQKYYFPTINEALGY